ncbi:MAG: tRNA (adenosine(37)-N6)-dimethylallyltransferase MiaA [SAR324 cluster bacterium]|nr:tRNA (adenosine(37)-N6)-dimethylallyltransferase MiaA [SAR324 cluster bacterium]
MLKKPKVIFITGPTASGKTKLAVQLAQELSGEVSGKDASGSKTLGTVKAEIISADSRQVFIGMDLGTGKDLAEYQKTPYHLIDILPAGTKFSAAKFQTLAMRATAEIIARGNLPIICGGTGHYLKSLVQDYQFETPATDVVRTSELEALPKAELLGLAQKAGVGNLEKLSGDSKRRIARELERLEQPQKTDQPESLEQAAKTDQPEKLGQSPTNNFKANFSELYQIQGFYLSPPREVVKAKIAKRLTERFEQGMILEIESLLAQGVDLEILKSYGLEYKWISHFLNDECDQDSMKISLERDIKAFAKRQMTFIRYMVKEGVKMDEIRDFSDLHTRVLEFLKF